METFGAMLLSPVLGFVGIVATGRRLLGGRGSLYNDPSRDDLRVKILSCYSRQKFNSNELQTSLAYVTFFLNVQNLSIYSGQDKTGPSKRMSQDKK